VAPWYIAVQSETGGTFLREFIFHQNIQRALGKDFDHNQPFYTYVPIYLLTFFPWAAFVPVAWKRLVRLRPTSNVEMAALFVAVWMAVVFLVFSCIKSKLFGYIYPMYPASAMLVAALWARVIESEESAILRKSAWAAAGLSVLVGGALIAAPFVMGSKLPPGLTPPLAIMGAGLVLGSLVGLAMARRARPVAAFAAFTAGACVFLLAAIHIGLPTASKTMSDPIVALGKRIQSVAGPTERVFAYNLRPTPRGIPFYAQRPVPDIKTKADLRKALSQGPCLVIAQKGHADSTLARLKNVSLSGQYVFYRSE